METPIDITFQNLDLDNMRGVLKLSEGITDANENQYFILDVLDQIITYLEKQKTL